MKEEKYAYERRVIAFLDILGVKELLKEKDPRIFEIVSILSDYQTSEKPNFESTFFSDSIVISFLLSEDDKENLKNLRSLILDITLSLCARLFLKGILLRGSITIGDLYHKGNTIIGQALVDAYEMETKIAFYPRIILSKEIEELINRNNAPSKIHGIASSIKGDLGTIEITQNYASTLSIRISDDGYSYLHWLHWHIGQMVEEGLLDGIPIISFRPNFNSINEIKHTIENNLKHLNPNTSPFGKWRWMAVYFNQVMTERKLIEFQIDIESIKKVLNL